MFGLADARARPKGGVLTTSPGSVPVSGTGTGSASPSGVECANPLEDALAYQRPSNVDRLRAALSPRSAGIGAYSPVAKEKE